MAQALDPDMATELKAQNVTATLAIVAVKICMISHYTEVVLQWYWW